MGRLYIYLQFTKKLNHSSWMIHVGKYTIVPWMLWAIWVLGRLELACLDSRSKATSWTVARHVVNWVDPIVPRVYWDPPWNSWGSFEFLGIWGGVLRLLKTLPKSNIASKNGWLENRPFLLKMAQAGRCFCCEFQGPEVCTLSLLLSASEIITIVTKVGDTSGLKINTDWQFCR